MSHQLVSRSPDLQHLLTDGFEVEIIGGRFLRVGNVPYVTAKMEIARGALVTELTLAGEVTTRPADHIVRWTGEHPCNVDGSEIAILKHGSGREELDRDLVVHHSFSSKPDEGYADYYDKITNYVTIISSRAESIDPTVTARTWRVIESEDADSPFHYADTASPRVGIAAVARKLELDKVAIVGVGGTGSYVLDLIVKSGVKEIHLFDGDRFLQHNAFRAPGAASLDELRTIPLKVIYFRDLYSKIHRNIVAHDYRLDERTVGHLQGMAFVFLCMDDGPRKRGLIGKLVEWGISFIDVGMGVTLDDGRLGGILRVTTSTPAMRDHVEARIPFSEDDKDEDDIYDKNIQVADLNALNATLAVIKWKKLYGFYRDLEREHHSTYTIDSNMLISEDQT
jgi:hypothetical protein